MRSLTREAVLEIRTGNVLAKFARLLVIGQENSELETVDVLWAILDARTTLESGNMLRLRNLP